MGMKLYFAGNLREKVVESNGSYAGGAHAAVGVSLGISSCFQGQLLHHPKGLIPLGSYCW